MLKYICISDLHAGAPTSLIMPPPTTFSAELEPVTRAFAAALGSFLDASGAKPQLILLGDVLDLQFSNRARACRNGLGFLKALQQTGCLAKEVIATAGNHDHALWTDARQSLELDVLQDDPEDFTYRAATPAFAPTPGAQSRMLSQLVKRAGFDTVDFRYPNIGFANDDRAVMLHHGHFVETPYKLISTLRDAFSDHPREAMTVAEIAAENAGWIDFFWSTVGDTGFGYQASDFYQNMLSSVGFRRFSKKVATDIGTALSERLPMSGNLTVQEILRIATQVAVDSSLGRFRDTERYAEVIALTDDGYAGVCDYLNGPVARQMQDELQTDCADITFVFGHTHKPFAERLVVDGFQQPVKTYNTGGWTLNGPRLDNAEGAGMVLIDDALNVAMLHLFATPQDGQVAPASVTMLTDDAAGLTFKSEIERWLSAEPALWSALADAAHDGYEKRQKYLLGLTASTAEETA